LRCDPNNLEVLDGLRRWLSSSLLAFLTWFVKWHFVCCSRCEARIKRGHGGADLQYLKKMFVSLIPLKDCQSLPFSASLIQ
jgi:hypothetical protein